MSALSDRHALDMERFPLDAYLFHEAVGVVFIAIPKVGCSVLKRWLIDLARPGASRQSGFDVHHYALDELSLCLRPQAEAAAVLARTPAVAFIRDPFERLRSAFIDKFVYARSDELFEPATELLADWTLKSGSVAHGSAKPDLERGISFREFVVYITAIPEEMLDAHWRPQAAFLRCAPGATLIALEEMNATLAALGRALGAEPGRLGRTNVTRKEPTGACMADVPSGELHRAGQAPTLGDLLDADLTASLRRFFAEDLALYAAARKTCGLDAAGAIAGCRQRAASA